MQTDSLWSLLMDPDAKDQTRVSYSINPFPAVIEYFTPSFYAGDKYICFSEKNPNVPITNIFVHF